MGDDTCTIDGHARNIAYGERVGLTDDKTNIGVKEYRELQALYVQACKRTRVNGRALKAFELQAITFDTLCKRLLENWDSVEHMHKHLISKHDLTAGTGYAIKYTNMIINSAHRWYELAQKEMI